MTRKYNFNNAKYALLIVTDSQSIIKMFDWCMFYGDEFVDTRIIYNGNKLAITIYNSDEHDDFWTMQQFLNKSSDVKYIHILSDISTDKKEGLNNEQI